MMGEVKGSTEISTAIAVKARGVTLHEKSRYLLTFYTGASLGCVEAPV
jgi:hypothetical protein